MKQAKLQFPSSLEPVKLWAQKEGLEIYVVGGWVRDSLLGLPAWDADLCGPHLPEELANCLPADGSVTLHTRDAGLGTVELHAGGQVFEYTAFRRESYRPGGAHRPSRVTLGATMPEDAVRRDFKVNAMYLRITDDAFFDPTGGRDDLEKHVLSTTRNPQDVFNEDGLRLLRLVRQKAELEFRVEDDTLTAAKQKISYLADIAPERLREEIRRILTADLRHPEKQYSIHPVYNGLKTMAELSAWQYLSPTVRELCKREDRILAASQCAPDERLRLACLWQGLEADRAEAVCTSLRFSREDSRLIVFLTQCAAPRFTEEEFRLYCAHAGREDAERAVEVRRSLSLSGLCRPDPSEKAWLQKMIDTGVPFRIRDLNLDGRALTTLLGGPSPKVGRVKSTLWDICILNPEENHNERLLSLAASLADQEN